MVIRIPNMHGHFIHRNHAPRVRRTTGRRIGAAGRRAGHGVGFGPHEVAAGEQAVAVVEDVAYEAVEAGAEEVVQAAAEDGVRDCYEHEGFAVRDAPPGCGGGAGAAGGARCEVEVALGEGELGVAEGGRWRELAQAEELNGEGNGGVGESH